MAGIDINRTTAGVSLPPQVSADVWGLTVNESAVMKAARRINVPGSGIAVDIVNGVGDAAWVAETAPKPVVGAEFSNRQLFPHMMAIILPFSNQFRRDKAGLYRECVRVLPTRLGKLFDETALGEHPSPGAGFDTLAGAQQVEIDGATAFDDLLALRAALGVRPTAWITDSTLETALLGAKDTDGTRPFVSDYANDLSIGRIFGAPVYPTDAEFTEPVTGVVGDFANSAVWGSVEGIQYSESDQASLTLADNSTINLWQRNMFAVRFEIELLFGVRDLSKFARITSPIPTP